MNGETTFLIHQLKILHREIPIEAAKPRGEEQLAKMIQLFYHDIPLYIEKLRRLEEFEREADRVKRTYSLRAIGD